VGFEVNLCVILYALFNILPCRVNPIRIKGETYMQVGMKKVVVCLTCAEAKKKILDWYIQTML